jgi:diaminopimelate epimerase
MTPFRKVHGAGNDFILLADPHETRDWGNLAASLCHRRMGVGGDGVVVSERISAGTYTVTCYNSDGSVASMCGNALRCVARCAAEDHGDTRMTLLMGSASHEAVVDGSQIGVSVTVGAVTQRVLALRWGSQRLEFAAVNSGTEHVVAFARSLQQSDVVGLGRHVCHHAALAPAGANVNLAQVVDRCTLKIRTYERGVEAETLSCGSGAVAAVAVAREVRAVTNGPVTVRNEAGTPLRVGRPGDPHDSAVWLTGPAEVVYWGEMA